MAALDYSSTLGPGIRAFTSDRAVDFHKGDPAILDKFHLTAPQRDWLSAQGLSRPDGIIFPKQVHGDTIWRVTPKDATLTGRFEADAVVTAEIGLPIAVRTADCLPLLLYDPVKKVIAAVHAGWKSTRLEIAAKTVQVLNSEYGVRSADLRAVIGPCLRRESYQVGPEFGSYFPEDVRETAQGLCLDLVAVNMRQILGVGLKKDHIFDCGRCTFIEAERLYSYRREGESAGRMINAIMMV